MVCYIVFEGTLFFEHIILTNCLYWPSYFSLVSLLIHGLVKPYRFPRTQYFVKYCKCSYGSLLFWFTLFLVNFQLSSWFGICCEEAVFVIVSLKQTFPYGNAGILIFFFIPVLCNNLFLLSASYINLRKFSCWHFNLSLCQVCWHFLYHSDDLTSCSSVLSCSSHNGTQQTSDAIDKISTQTCPPLTNNRQPIVFEIL